MESVLNIDFWDSIQVVGLFLSFTYLFLEFRQKKSLWIISAMCSTIYASVYFHSKIYADMSFSCFNILMCIYGYIQWLRNGRQKDIIEATENQHENIVYYHFTLPQLCLTVLACSAVWAVIFTLLKYFTDSPIPALDALTTALNIIGTWVLAQRIIEVWGIWFLVNVISLYIYINRGLHISTILMYVFYTGASIYGYIKWRVKGTALSISQPHVQNNRGRKAS